MDYVVSLNNCFLLLKVTWVAKVWVFFFFIARRVVPTLRILLHNVLFSDLSRYVKGHTDTGNLNEFVHTIHTEVEIIDCFVWNLWIS